ncbi:deoxyuridine 5'-triphosphate nucleotidohydrolase [Halobacteriales archaeon QS_1_69_70]|nr:MAG: deoxyuridine 5'-triphosphate nucleotidohydrolase [Halobacteriales archaeon QS_1_69_70]
MYRSGAFVADQVTPTTDEQVQPNGVDLTLEAVFEQREPGRIGRDGKEVGSRLRRPADPALGGDAVEGGADRAGTHYLPPGGYVVRYAEVVSVPDDHVGFVHPRSSLMRNSCMLNTAVWDAGYEGKGEGPTTAATRASTSDLPHARIWPVRGWQMLTRLDASVRRYNTQVRSYRGLRSPDPT